MALKATDGRYLKIRKVIAETQDDTLSVIVNFDVYKNEQARREPDYWTVSKPDTYGFDNLPQPDWDGQHIPSECDKMKARGYLLLKGHADFNGWEDC